MWQEALSIFLESYSPCSRLEESSHQFGTAEIGSMIEQHTGEPVALTDLVQKLTDRGFKYVRTGDLSLEWLMKQNEIVL